MISTRHPVTLLLLCAFAGPCLLQADGLAAQDRMGEWPSSIQAAIEEIRRTPFHVPHRTGFTIVAHDEVLGGIGQPWPEPKTQTTDPGESTVSGGNIFFFGLPVVAVLDLLAMSEVGDEGFMLDPLASVGAIAAPAALARLLGGRTVFALVGSVLGFGSGALITKAFGKSGIFLAPALHAGATALFSALGGPAG